MNLRALRLLLILLALAAPIESAAQSTTLLLTVSDTDNNILVGARIHIVDWVTGRLVATLKSGEDGSASIQVTPSRGYVISTSLAGYHSEPVSPAPPPGDVYVPLKMVRILSSEVDEGLPPPGRSSLSGFVRSATGRPLTDVWVTAAPADPGDFTFRSTRTGPDGSYRMTVTSGNYVVRAHGLQEYVVPTMLTSPSYLTYEPAESLPVFAMAGRRATVDLVLTPRERLFRVTVVVLDDLGRKVPGASVEWFGSRERYPPGFIRGKLETDSSGSVTLGAFSSGPLTILATAVPGGSDLAGDASVETLNAPREITVRLLPGPKVFGRVVFTDGRPPLHGGDGLRVSLQRPGSKATWFTSNDPGLMDPDGRFSLGPVSGEGCLRVRGIPSGWRLAAIEHQGQDVNNRVVQFHWNEIYDLIVRIEPGVNELEYEVPECRR